MNKPQSELGSGIEKALSPAAAISAALAVPWALANTGDLDPGFGDVGRVVSIPGAVGSARAVELLDDGSAIVAGGDLQIECDFYCYWYYYLDYRAFDFVEHITADGAIDPNFDAAQLENTEVFDAIRQPDAKIVAVGREVSRHNFDPHSIVFRLGPNGALDTSFGAGGRIVLASADFGENNEAHAVTIDSSNRIIMAGHRDGALLVVRLLADGTLDDSFGAGGAFIGSAFGQGWKVLPAPGGGYRVLTSGQDCRIIGLTDAGALDNAFGTAGVVSVGELPGGGDSCASLALDATGRLLVSGASSDGGFLIRLLASGVIDGTFAADSLVSETLWSAGPMREAHDGKIVLAGSGIDGVAIMRLQASGALDPLFGNEGRTWIDLPTKGVAVTTIEDLTIDANGVIVAAGRSNPDKPFLIKLIGDAGGDSPGVLGVAPQSYAVAEQDGEAVINVRRTGGSAGQVRIHYYTSTDGSATSDQDFGAVSGVLTWNDGDTDDKQVSIPVLADAGPEEGETFRLLLSSIQGGAGYGTRTAFVDINPDGSPGGQFAVDSGWEVSESDTLEFYVARNFYFQGAVSVTVTASSGTATAGDDFAATAVTLNWSDQDSSAKLVEIPILNDDLEEGSENFTVELSDPTNGAIIGPHASTRFTISASDAPPPPPPPPPPRRGGAGAADLALLASLGLLACFRRRPAASEKDGKQLTNKA